MKHLAIVVDWYGPYTLEEAVNASAADYSSGLYLAIGKVKYGRKLKPQYVGLSKDLTKRLVNHHKLPEITRNFSIWLGEVATAEQPGKKRKLTSAPLDYAEWLHAYFMQLPLNSKKKINAPDRPVTVLNRWFGIDYETLYLKRPHASWPDLIDFVGPNTEAKVIWFGRRQIRHKPPYKLNIAG